MDYNNGEFPNVYCNTFLQNEASFLGGIVAAAFACLTDASAETAMTIAIPVAVLGQLLGIVFRSIIAVLTHVADNAIDNGKFKTAYRMHICAGSGLYAIMYFLPIFLAVFVGTDLVQAIVNMVPEWLSTGLNVSTKIMTAYGLALLLTMMIKKGMTPFLFIGFLLAAYLNLSVIAVALIGVCLAVVFMGFKFNGSHAAAGVDSDYDPLEDDED